MWKETPLAASLTLLDVLSWKGGKAETPFQFPVIEEGCSGGKLQSSTWKHAGLENEVFQPFLRVAGICKNREVHARGFTLTPCACPFGCTCASRGLRGLNPANASGTPQNGAVLQPHGEGLCLLFPTAAPQPARLLLLPCFRRHKLHAAAELGSVLVDSQLCYSSWDKKIAPDCLSQVLFWNQCLHRNRVATSFHCQWKSLQHQDVKSLALI